MDFDVTFCGEKRKKKRKKRKKKEKKKEKKRKRKEKEGPEVGNVSATRIEKEEDLDKRFEGCF